MWFGCCQIGCRLCWRQWLKRMGSDQNRWLTSIKHSQNLVYITSTTVCDFNFFFHRENGEERRSLMEYHFYRHGGKDAQRWKSALFQTLTIAYWLFPTPCCISKTFSFCRPPHDVPLSFFAAEHINGCEGRPALSLDETIRWWRQSTTWHSCMMAKRR